MELRQLQYFLAVAASENFTQASKELHVSQPSLSTSIKNLERELSVTLFDREGKHITLNANGRYFAERISSMQTLLDEATRTVVDRDLNRSKTVNCTIAIPLGHSGKLIRAFNETHPDISLRIGYPYSHLFTDQTIDMHLFGSAVEVDDDNVIKLGREDYVIVLPPDHRLADAPSVKLRDLKDDPFVFTEPSEIYNESKSMCRQAGFEPHVVNESQVFSEALGMVEAGIGCCIAAEFTWLAGMDLTAHVKTIEDAHRSRYLYARLPDDMKPSPATWDFVDFLQDYGELLKKNPPYPV